VATDFSVPATRALTRAARLPLAKKAAITIVHVVEAGLQRHLEQAIISDATVGLAECVTVVREAAGRLYDRDLEVHTAIPRGKPFVEILHRAREEHAELVVVGRRGRRRLRDMLLGSTAERVVRKGDIPVLVVAAPATSPYRRPLIALDGSRPAIAALELALKVLGSHPRTIEVVSAYDVDHESALRRAGASQDDLRKYRKDAKREARARLDEALAPYRAHCPVKWNTVLRSGDPRRVILEQARRGCDLVVLGRTGQSRLAEILLGSVAEAVLREAPCDVLLGSSQRPAFKLP
jgi:nucleotide-binding universal stress UspA family protein